MYKSHILKKAILSEKTYKLMESGVYTFLVDKNATKDQIAKAVNYQFATDVAHVNISQKYPKTKRVAQSRKTTKTKSSKKAIVFLKSGQKIEMLSAKAKTSTKKSQTAKKEEK